MLIAVIRIRVGSSGRVPRVNPHFYRLRKEAIGKDWRRSATEICGRDSLSLVLCISNSK
jgi:hypothetical protein